jgi:hypothetical protein
MTVEGTCCCGIGEFDGIDERPKIIIEDFFDHLDGYKLKGIYIFTDAVRNGNGEKLAKFIVENKLGTVQSSKSKMNPNTGRTVKLWIYYPTRKGLAAYKKKIGYDV